MFMLVRYSNYLDNNKTQLYMYCCRHYFFVWLKLLAANSSCSFKMPSTLVVFSIIKQLIRCSQMVGMIIEGNGGQALFDSIASWVCDLIPCFLDQASQYGGERTRTCTETKNYFSNIELFLFHASCWNERILKMFEDLSYL